MKEWKIDNWWKKTLITAAAIQGFLTILTFFIGFFGALIGVY